LGAELWNGNYTKPQPACIIIGLDSPENNQKLIRNSEQYLSRFLAIRSCQQQLLMAANVRVGLQHANSLSICKHCQLQSSIVWFSS